MLHEFRIIKKSAEMPDGTKIEMFYPQTKYVETKRKTKGHLWWKKETVETVDSWLYIGRAENKDYIPLVDLFWTFREQYPPLCSEKLINARIIIEEIKDWKQKLILESVKNNLHLTHNQEEVVYEEKYEF